MPELADSTPARGPRVRPAVPLTATETAVVRLVIEGLTGREIAATMGISLPTVRTHIERAARKIPGDLPPVARLRAWWRGASAAVLGGSERA